MGINFHPRAGTLLMCDFRGAVPPEINKRRPVVVITPRLANRDQLAMVVPTSTTEPRSMQPFHVRLLKNYHPNEPDDLPVWAKCDLVSSVSFARLDRFHVGHRRFEAPMISADDLASIRKGVLAALGLVD
ncbi:type II toxin-antitoxin system PemK/MazF family toxin [Xanthobacter tagetidis]|uniref:Type II toxin-antitoxin system PemK/MazF family toxin n=1 Tax=Xanthobacter tagetidis TaxID=60216 RepID=A0A3L7A8D7_9HYPH|nr:type II toxin-antitoxin system PemK/MazF family toxin [Xanthobacter tagetidis]MBB6309359.1 uncharacterized protein YifN (PemK superfamily) [Xanthobacter tagetidis]RLP76666.1 hypothetical protein D9R14_14855 [Xanthobacter tagetidis]